MIRNIFTFFRNPPTIVKCHVLIMFLSFSIMSTGCKDEDYFRVGCEGAVINNLDNTTLLVTGSVMGHVFLSEDFGIISPNCPKSQTIDELYREWAEREEYDWRSINPNGLWVTTSGPLYKSTENVSQTEFLLMSVTEIQEVNGENILEEFGFYLFEVPYKDTFGYGYYLDYNGLKIKQYLIPAVPGTQPFKTRGEALKIAYLVAYKLKKQQGMPAVEIRELSFFNIETEW